MYFSRRRLVRGSGLYCGGGVDGGGSLLSENYCVWEYSSNVSNEC